MSAIDTVRANFIDSATPDDPNESPDQRAARFDAAIQELLHPTPRVSNQQVNDQLAAVKNEGLDPNLFARSLRLFADNPLNSADSAADMHELADKIEAAVAPLPEQLALSRYADLLEAHSEAAGWTRDQIVADLRQYVSIFRDIPAS